MNSVRGVSLDGIRLWEKGLWWLVTTRSFTFDYHLCIKFVTPCRITGLTTIGGRADRDVRWWTGWDGGLAFSSVLQLERIYLSSFAVCPSGSATCPGIELGSGTCSLQYPQRRMWPAESKYRSCHDLLSAVAYPEMLTEGAKCDPCWGGRRGEVNGGCSSPLVMGSGGVTHGQFADNWYVVHEF